MADKYVLKRTDIADIEKEKELINKVIEKAYEVLAFDPGGMPRWEEFMECFYEDSLFTCRMFPQDPEVQLLSLKEYTISQMRYGLQEEGYEEVPVSNDMEIFGDIAWVRQYFTANYGDGTILPAIDLFLLAKRNGIWKIAAVAGEALKAGEFPDVDALK